MRIAVLTPSRARPIQFAEMVQAIRKTADGTVGVYLGTDEDDQPMYPYNGTDPRTEVTVHHFRGPRKRLAEWTNELARTALEDGGADVLAFFGDDHRPRTPGWDTRVREAFERMGPGLVYCADGLQDERLPTAPFWSADIVRALGWYYPPVLKHLYADNYWLRLAHDLGRCTYLGDVLIEHMHPSARMPNGTAKGTMDDSYRESAAWERQDREAFEKFIRDEHPLVLERVRGRLLGL